jgi:ribosomal protein L44E
MAIEMLEDSEIQSRAEIELVCPWCHIHSISAIVNHRMLRLRCSECGMDAFVSRIPRNKKLGDYIPRRLIA